MLVLKFGGTSVGSAERIKEVEKLVNTPDSKIVVLSAMSGTTNKLIEIANYLYKKNNEGANELISNLEQNYYEVVKTLFSTPEYIEKGNELIQSHFKYIKSFTQDLFTIFEEKAILAQGELLSTALFHYYLSEQNIPSVLLPALNYMRIDKDGEPDLLAIKENLKKELDNNPEQTLFITQGFICRNAYGEIDNLKRGGTGSIVEQMKTVKGD